MYIHIDNKGVITLQDHNNMKNFSIMDDSNGDCLSALDKIGIPAEDNHFWLDADKVIQLSPAEQDMGWVNSFWEMLKLVEPYGFSNLETRQIKAHLQVMVK